MRVFALPVLLAGLMAVPASAQSFVGEWRATATVGETEVSEALSVTKAAEGYAIAATTITEVPPGSPTAGPGFDIKLEGNNFSYKRKASTAQADMEIVYTGIVSGDTFTGKAEVGGYSMPYNGVRTAPEK